MAQAFTFDLTSAPAKVPMSPAPIPVETPIAANVSPSGMIFLRRSDRGWLMRAFGVRGIGGQNEIPLPCPIEAPLVDVITALQGRFPAVWLLVAPTP